MRMEGNNVLPEGTPLYVRGSFSDTTSVFAESAPEGASNVRAPLVRNSSHIYAANYLRGSLSYSCKFALPPAGGLSVPERALFNPGFHDSFYASPDGADCDQ